MIGYIGDSSQINDDSLFTQYQKFQVSLYFGDSPENVVVSPTCEIPWERVPYQIALEAC